MPRRSYAHYCAVARSLDVVGERWTLLVVRELALGPRRYTDLHADLPGISTDVLAARLKELEADGIVERQKQAHAWVYELTSSGAELAPVLTALAAWGTRLLATQQATDALRSHWSVLPLAALLHEAAQGFAGVVDLHIDSTRQAIELTPSAPSLVESPPAIDATFTLTTGTAQALLAGDLSLPEALESGDATLTPVGPLYDVLAHRADV